jgi:leucyl aminopeptidase
MQLNIQNSQLLITSNKDKYDINVLFSFEHQLLDNAKRKFPNIDLASSFVTMGKVGSILVQDGQIICSLGKEDQFNLENSLVSLKTLVNFIKENSIKSINIILESNMSKYLDIDEFVFYENTIFHVLNFFYYFDELKSKKHQLELTQINFETQSPINEYINNAISMVQSLFLLRDLANKPANIATPSYIASRVSEFDKLNKNVTVKVLDKNDIEAEQMNAFLAVSKGSIEEPKFVVLEYLAGKEAKPIVLIGKGVTFDSGGISLKPSMNMDSMKYDMCGAATVIALFEASVRLNLGINLIVLVPLCENMPSGSAIKPGDVIKTMSGQTVEILNTDAEGRLILCDALTYAKRYEPEVVIDIATLTGGCIMALGNVASAIYSNDSEILTRLLNASSHSLDSTWNLPLFKEYHKMLDSKTADIANIASWKGYASSPTAACFLEKFVDYKWVHLDIAGVADGESKFNPIGYTGATGRPFYMLIEYLRSFIFKY